MYKNIPAVYISKRDCFELEFIVDAVGEVTLYVDSENTDGTVSSDKIITKEKLKSIIDGLTNIYDEIKG